MSHDQDHGLTIATDEIPFKPVADGVEIRVVYADEESGVWTVMVHAKPGSVLPRHRHVSGTELYILQGAGEHPQTGAFKAGDYVLEPAGAVHEPLVHPEETMLIMRSAGEIAFLADDGATTLVLSAGMLKRLAAA
ncbi:cupin domain-containing protein [Nocardia sp. NPDC050793]|uniref:cupin domain-containing protein n=1 Tax=Nocardia sp. NPDC050793 TaxID=3155159 RepID=UPI0033CBDE84